MSFPYWILKSGLTAAIAKYKPWAFRIVLIATLGLAVVGPIAFVSTTGSLKPAASSNHRHVKVHAFFSPGEKFTPTLLANVDDADSEILVQAYYFTLEPLASSLGSARKRGVKVKVILDPVNEQIASSQLKRMQEAGIDVRVDDRHRIAHSKIIVFDRLFVWTGSYNFTQAAETDNAENGVLIDDPDVAEAYAKNWQEHWNHSRLPYSRR